MFDLQGLFNSFAEIKRTKLYRSVVQTKMNSLFDLQGLFNNVTEIKRTTLYKQCCINKTEFIV